jgi:hypothetical protein
MPSPCPANTANHPDLSCPAPTPHAPKQATPATARQDRRACVIPRCARSYCFCTHTTGAMRRACSRWVAVTLLTPRLTDQSVARQIGERREWLLESSLGRTVAIAPQAHVHNVEQFDAEVARVVVDGPSRTKYRRGRATFRITCLREIVASAMPCRSSESPIFALGVGEPRNFTVLMRRLAWDSGIAADPASPLTLALLTLDRFSSAGH